MSYRPKKRFGQNFLRDRNIVDKIIAAADLSPTDHVLEIGPGLGAMTDRMLPLAGQVTVMEIDRNLVAKMHQRSETNLRVIEGDALDLDWSTLLTDPPYKLVANLPYNISSQILFKIIDHRYLFSRLVLMFQKEVGDRIGAAPGSRDYGAVSVLCQLHFDVRRVTLVAPGCFSPPPKVDSVVLEINPLKAPRVDVPDEPLFRRVVKGAFAQRRKTLRNTLCGSGFEPEDLDRAFEHTGIDPGRRGETLSLEEFSRLTLAIGQA